MNEDTIGIEFGLSFRLLKGFENVQVVLHFIGQFIAGAVGDVVKKNVQDYALKQGMFIVQQSGENVEIFVPEGKPMIW